jgi:Tol biopolymer transport system component
VISRRHLRSQLPGLAAVILMVGGASGALADEPGAPRAPRRLMIAFASLRDRPAFSSLLLYRHDGLGKGEPAGTIPPLNERADSHPALTADGTVCAYASKQTGGFTPLINFWHVREQRLLPGPAFNNEPGARIEPSLGAGGRLLAFSTRSGTPSAGGWDAGLFDMTSGKILDLAGLNTDADEREVALSREGRFLAFVTNRPGGEGLSDIALYDREVRGLVLLPGLNSAHRELNPALSADGRWLAFVSDRPGGPGGKDIFLYDRSAAALVELPALNSVAHEQSPVLSPDGRYLAFVSERTSGAGERDIFLYDRETRRLLPTPGLNSKQEDFDPSLAFDDSVE